ncbi:hypothetical protein T07_2146 [Trichinella nelsoni]|uniref:Uncharacterized protein n=1 Tax=Trichinella nelsoni TaxID=6336 RepID=A0A0V0S544_9BILA|nr:hypothetical protein T07_2146 [Trichinella nelsoni]
MDRNDPLFLINYIMRYLTKLLVCKGTNVIKITNIAWGKQGGAIIVLSLLLPLKSYSYAIFLAISRQRRIHET